MLRPSRILRYAQAAAAEQPSWSETLSLPKTTFPARPSPEDLASYRRKSTQDLYAWQKENRPAQDEDGRDNTFVLHDGPPYANGAVHVGHAVNKILKDLIVRTNLSRGKQVRYRPGWDCHGLPIELKALRAAGNVDLAGSKQQNDLAGGEAETKGATPVADALNVRRMARSLADQTVQEQSASFQSWGVMGDWEEPYLTMDKEFEIRQLGVFKAMVAKGLIYRQNKPVHWSPSSRTALAEAELEYNDNHKVTTGYIKFPITKLPPILANNGYVDPSRLTALIWTTTPWTLPANTAIGIRSDITYSLIEAPDEGQMIVAKDRLESLKPHFKGVPPEVIINEIPGSALLEGSTEYVNVLSGKTSRLIGAEFVTSTSGTGLVHLASGHGMEDYLTLRAQGFDEVVAPVDDAGKFTAEAYPSEPSRVEGLYVESKGARAILEILRERPSSLPVKTHPNVPLVFATEDMTHKHPIDWRTKQSVIIRATDQWFADVGQIQGPAISSLEEVKFIPESGKTRLQSFLKGRSQWCISRQRAWGVPIPALFRKATGEAVMTVESIEHIMRVIEERGTDAWWSDPPNDPTWVSSSLEPGEYVRGKDTMDVWFDSGTSWTSLTSRDDKPVADIYVEGTDQHRGWFQSSVLTHVSPQSADHQPMAPFSTLVTHGFTLDQAGHKMSKSVGNVVTPDEILNGVLKTQPAGKPRSNTIQLRSQNNRQSSLGPDALRLWVATSDYTRDITISQPSILAVHQALNKYRVTFKWLLGVLTDYPEPNITPELMNDLTFADQMILHNLSKTANIVHRAQADYDFARATQEINAFVNKHLSAEYVEVVKDRLYAGAADDRMHTQTVLYIIMEELLHMLTPVCPLLVEEVWAHYPPERRENNTHPLHRIWDVPFEGEAEPDLESDALFERIVGLMGKMGGAVKVAQEEARRRGKLGSGLACSVEILVPEDADEDFALILSNVEEEEELADLLVVSQVEVLPKEEEARRQIQRDEENDEVIGEVARQKAEWRASVEWEFEAEFDCGGEGTEGVKGLVKVLPPLGDKCQRCWKFDVVEDDDPICTRCQEVLGLVGPEGEEGEGEDEEGGEQESEEEEEEDEEEGDGEYEDPRTSRDIRNERKRMFRNRFGIRG